MRGGKSSRPVQGFVSPGDYGRQHAIARSIQSTNGYFGAHGRAHQWKTACDPGKAAKRSFNIRPEPFGASVAFCSWQ